MNAKLSLAGLLIFIAVAVRAADDGQDEAYLLRYKLAANEEIRWKVVHLGTTETTIRGNTQTSKSRSASTKVWRVTGVDEHGNMTIVHSVAKVDMWQQLTDRPLVRYNSETDKKVPREYQQVAKTIGIPLTTVTISPKGDILDRESERKSPDLGVGAIVMLLPEKPVKIGATWYEPSELRTRLQDGRVKRVKIRKLYSLEKVKTGVATIHVKTEVLTPVNDARIKAQLVQQLTAGTIKFDIESGRILSKQVDWDETVVGFNGADSLMKYLARFTEELLPASEYTARRQSLRDGQRDSKN